MAHQTDLDIIRALARRERIDAPVAMVVAHPDDETACAGGSLDLFTNLLLVHVTDGAPESLRDAQTAGYPTRKAYAAARARELHRALTNLPGIRRPQRAALRGLPLCDQSASLHMAALSEILSELLAGVTAVLTHAFEGGHPDHDAVAFAVQRTRLPVIEMAGYHADALGRLEVGRFVTNENVAVAPLSAEQRARRDARLACFVSQQETLRPFFGWQEEHFRMAPEYDFTKSPAPCIYYDAFDWGMRSAGWRQLAAEAMRCCAL